MHVAVEQNQIAQNMGSPSAAADESNNWFFHAQVEHTKIAALDAREAVMRVAALEESLDYAPLDRASYPPCLAQLPRVPARALP
jgi:hypothetical protein